MCQARTYLAIVRHAKPCAIQNSAPDYANGEVLRKILDAPGPAGANRFPSRAELRRPEERPFPFTCARPGSSKMCALQGSVGLSYSLRVRDGQRVRRSTYVCLSASL